MAKNYLKNFNKVKDWFYSSPYRIQRIAGEFHLLKKCGWGMKTSALEDILPVWYLKEFPVWKMSEREVEVLSEAVLQILPKYLYDALDRADKSFPAQLWQENKNWKK